MDNRTEQTNSNLFYAKLDGFMCGVVVDALRAYIADLERESTVDSLAKVEQCKEVRECIYNQVFGFIEENKNK